MGDMSKLIAFRALIQSTKLESKPLSQQKFVKKTKGVPFLVILVVEPYRKSLILSKRALNGKFTSLWPNLRVVELWIAK